MSVPDYYNRPADNCAASSAPARNVNGTYFSYIVIPAGHCGYGVNTSLAVGTFIFPATCSGRASEVTLFFPPSGSIGCTLGCEVVYRDNGDDTTTRSTNGKVCDGVLDCSDRGANYVWHPQLLVCMPVGPECPPGSSPAGDACSPIEDGEGENGEDVDGGEGETGTEGEGDDENADDKDGKDTKQFSGGETCDSPPSCSGDVILCGQARIQWRIDCNTRSDAKITGGSCSSSDLPICTGKNCNAMEYSMLVQQWRIACAAEKMANNSSANLPGDGTATNWDTVDWSKVNMSTDPGDGDTPGADGIITDNKGFGVDDIKHDTSGAGACVAIPIQTGGVLSAGFGNAFASPPPMWCNYIASMYYIFTMIGTVVSAVILAKGAA